MSIQKKLFLAATVLTLATLVAVIIVKPQPHFEEPLPSPNGYDDFLKAGSLISGDAPYWQDVSIEELRPIVATNQSILELVRAGLTKQCRVVPYSMPSGTNNHLNDLAAAKRIAHAFAAAGEIALLDGRTNEAASLALDCIRYGNELSRGGVIIDALVGIAVQSIGRARLHEALPGVDSATSQRIVATLDDVLRSQESPRDVFKREAQWAQKGRFGRVSFFQRLIQRFLTRKTLARAEQKFIKGGVDLQRTKLRAAVRAYELDHGQPPAMARDLVPHYLKSVPLDAATGQEMPLN